MQEAWGHEVLQQGIQGSEVQNLGRKPPERGGRPQPPLASDPPAWGMGLSPAPHSECLHVGSGARGTLGPAPRHPHSGRCGVYSHELMQGFAESPSSSPADPPGHLGPGRGLRSCRVLQGSPPKHSRPLGAAERATQTQVSVHGSRPRLNCPEGQGRGLTALSSLARPPAAGGLGTRTETGSSKRDSSQRLIRTRARGKAERKPLAQTLSREMGTPPLGPELPQTCPAPTCVPW